MYSGGFLCLSVGVKSINGMLTSQVKKVNILQQLRSGWSEMTAPRLRAQLPDHNGLLSSRKLRVGNEILTA
jgi:hypothetical protein